MLADSIDAKKWYSVDEVSRITGWSCDTVRRWIQRKWLRAFVQPSRGTRRTRIYRAARILGADLILFIRRNLNFE